MVLLQNCEDGDGDFVGRIEVVKCDIQTTKPDQTYPDLTLAWPRIPCQFIDITISTSSYLIVDEMLCASRLMQSSKKGTCMLTGDETPFRAIGIESIFMNPISPDMTLASQRKVCYKSPSSR